MGKAKYSKGSTERISSLPLTNTLRDFNKDFADQMLSIDIKDLKGTVIFVCKKNVRTLDNLIKWINDKNDSKKLDNFPLLLIDDEADYASINTKIHRNKITQKPENPTSTNAYIRRLLDLFAKNCYLGYTATPFANSFILPESDDALEEEDLFPKDFIYELEAPTNYFGPNRLFKLLDDQIISGEKDNILIKIEDNEPPPSEKHHGENDHREILPIRQKRDFQVTELPQSLYEAIDVFLISSAIRSLRGDINKDMTMMVNCSPKIIVQNDIGKFIREYIHEKKDIIEFNAFKHRDSALKNVYIKKLYDLKVKYFSNVKEQFDDILPELDTIRRKIEVSVINSSKEGEKLEYEDPNGRILIAIGGFTLSRGITLKGLSVTYLIRNVAANDTLLQLGRWFGYRDGYDDLCKIYMVNKSIKWYVKANEIINDLTSYLNELRVKRKLTPKEFGIIIRNDPGALELTAFSKMRSSVKEDIKFYLDGQLMRTPYLWAKEEIQKSNEKLVEELFKKCSESSTPITDSSKYFLKKNNLMFISVDASLLINFIKDFKWNDSKSLINHASALEHLKQKDYASFDVVYHSGDGSSFSFLGNHKLKRIKRKIEYHAPHQGQNAYYEISRRGVTTQHDEKQAYEIPDEGLDNLKDLKDINIRLNRKRPLLLIYLNQLSESCEKDIRITEFVSYALVFPGGKKKNIVLE